MKINRYRLFRMPQISVWNSFQLALFTVCISNIILADNTPATAKLVITVFSQPGGYQAARAHRLRDNLLEQAEELNDVSIKVILTHELGFVNSWAIGPFLPYLVQDSDRPEWYMFCEVNTYVRLGILKNVLNVFNYTEDVWLGHVLYDHEPTIIHHFSERTKKFKYPNTASGFVMSAPLVKKLAQRVVKGEKPEGEFSIDASYEFATFVWDNGRGKPMLHVSQFCVVSVEGCATYPQHFNPCGKSIPIEKIYVAVKTCSKFHTERLPVIRKTWTKYAVNIGFYSDKADRNLPEAILTPDTKQGHCAKTYSILEHSSKILSNKKLDWLVITDDDTIFSLGRLQQLLTCYNSENPVALGERYGFRLWENSGYSYLTGGAGLALSANLVQILVKQGFCSCPSPSAPDDMFLFGVCLKRAGIQPTHSPYFHQARPDDYSRAYLASQEPVSFHKFWLVDPEQVYKEWFAEADASLFSSIEHTEL